MNEEFKIELRRSFEIADNGNGTQNLHSLVYQNSNLISECDLGNIEDILMQNKKLQNNWNELKKWVEEIYNEENKYNFCTEDFAYNQVLCYMQELEQGKDE